ncbi:MAG: hypothetical protein HRU19_10600 [Pseudobacteriovorax sp.]|nr:hypothetical protein [Pseudobacteriovorax sp.]
MEALKEQMEPNPVAQAFTTKHKSHDEAKKYKNFQKNIKEVTKLKMQEICKDHDVVLQECPDPYASMFAHWMTLIMVSGKKIKLCLKTHFNTADSFYLREQNNRKRKKKTEVDLLKSFDFMKELSNESAGRIKTCLGSENSAMGLSLPLVTRGFDEVLFIDRIIKTNHGDERSREAWRLKVGDHIITYTAEIQIMDWDVLNDLRDPNKESTGNLEFL